MEIEFKLGEFFHEAYKMLIIDDSNDLYLTFKKNSIWMKGHAEDGKTLIVLRINHNAILSYLNDQKIGRSIICKFST